MEHKVLEDWDREEVIRAGTEARDASAPIIRQALRVRDVDELEARTAEPDDIEERTCTYASICRREGEVVERDDDALYAREASADGAA